MGISGWRGVDLDGTLAYYDGWKGIEHIGSPIPLMLQRVKDWINKGETVKIFTARAVIPEQIEVIERWLDEHGIGGLEITNKKDFSMISLYDDRCIQVVVNTGELVEKCECSRNDRLFP